MVVDSLALESHKTRDAAVVFNALAGGNALVVDGPNRNPELAVGNLPKVKYLNIDGMNLFDVLKYTLGDDRAHGAPFEGAS